MTAISIIGGVGGGAINGGNVALTYTAGTGPGDIAVVAVTLGTSKVATLAVTSSSGGAGFYTQIVSTIQSSNVRFGVFRRVIISSAELGCLITGTGGSTDSTSGVVFSFENVDRASPEDATATSTNGSGTAPDSPSITVNSCGTAIISAIGNGFSASIPTAPSSFLNNVRGNGTDTNPATTAMAWITNATTAAFDPTAWTSTSATWISATIALDRQFDQGYEKGWLGASELVDEARRVVIRSY